MGLDIGDRRIGVALSDPVGILATPLSVLERRDETDDIEAIIGIIRDNQVERVIVGWPLTLNGRAGEQAEKVKTFTEKLEKRSPVPVILRDERLSTVAAQRLKRQAGSRKRGQRKHHDDLAAALILQNYLDEPGTQNVT